MLPPEEPIVIESENAEDDTTFPLDQVKNDGVRTTLDVVKETDTAGAEELSSEVTSDGSGDEPMTAELQESRRDSEPAMDISVAHRGADEDEIQVAPSSGPERIQFRFRGRQDLASGTGPKVKETNEEREARIRRQEEEKKKREKEKKKKEEKEKKEREKEKAKQSKK